jgi:multicomponent Na+:H+ antiporter subunit B
MNEILLKATFRFLGPLLILSSFYLFLRGHNLPGGGFIGGLCLSLAFILYILASENSKLDSWLKKYFTLTIAICLIGLAIVFFIPVILQKPPMTGLWSTIPLPIAGKFSSVLVFDFFIYVLVAVCTTKAYLEFTDFSGKGRFK